MKRLKRKARPLLALAAMSLSGCIVTPEGQRRLGRAVDDASSFLFLVIFGSLALLLLLVAASASAD